MSKKIVTKINSLNFDEVLYPASFKIKDDKEKVIFEDDSNKGANGTLVYTYKLPQDQSGGEYLLEISSYLFPTAQRKIRFRSYSERNLFVTVDFQKDSYSPGDQVQAKIKVRRADGQSLKIAEKSISFTANFEYSSPSQSGLSLDSAGELLIQFNIPLNTYQDILSLIVQVSIQNSFQETSVHSRVINQEKNLQIRFYPEGGSIIKKLVNLVYFQCLADQEGTDIAEYEEAKIISIDKDGLEIEEPVNIPINMNKLHNGRGKFQMNFDEDLIYMMKVKWTKSSSWQKYLIPKIDSTKSIVFNMQQTVFDQSQDENIAILFLTNQKKNKAQFQLNIQKKEKVIYNSTLKMAFYNQYEDVLIKLKDLKEEDIVNGGVFQIILFEKITDNVLNEEHITLVKLKERLIFIKPKYSLSVQIQMNQIAFTPGDSINFSIKINDSNNLEDDQIFYSVHVTDESSFIEAPKRAKQPSLPAMVYLENEIYQTFGPNEFWYADDYIEEFFNQNAQTQDSTLKLDLLLGVQGWRRFVFVEEDLEKVRERLYQMEDKDPEKFRLQRLLAEKLKPRFYYMARAGVRPDIMFKNADIKAREENFNPAENMEVIFQNAVPMAESASIVQNDLEENKDIEIAEPQSGYQSNMNETTQSDFMDSIPKNTRQYTHLRRKGWNMNSQRQDFTQTLKFISAQEYQKENQIQFDLNDQITSFRILVTAYSKSGRYGYSAVNIQTKKPFTLAYELPQNFINGDSLYIPIVLTNNQNSQLDVVLNLNQIGEASNKSIIRLILEPYKSQSYEYLFKAFDSNKEGKVVLTTQATAKDQNGNTFIDGMTKSAFFLPKGFQQKFSQSGLIGISPNSQRNFSFTFQLPESYIDKTISVSSARIFAEPLDNILAAVESLIQEPYGCFEQCSSVTYPIVMALQFLQEAEKSAKNESQKVQIKKMIFSAQQKLEQGYKKLLTYESSEGGYEWFGSNPGHEALSAYGLMQFNEMKKVMPGLVNDEMTRRVQNWLLNRRDGSGGFKQSQQALDTFGRAPVNITNAYLVWILTGLGYTNIDKEINYLLESSKFTDDSYFLVLLAGSLINLNRNDKATQFLDRLVLSQNISGAVLGSKTSITSSSGQSLLIETTSLSLINWLKHDRAKYAQSIEKGTKYLISQIQDGGRMGSTQSTILSLKALILYLDQYSGIKGSGDFRLYIDEQFVSKISFDENKTENQITFDFSQVIQKYLYSFASKQNMHQIEIKIENYASSSEQDIEFQLSYLIQIDYFDQQPKSAEDPIIEFYLQLKEQPTQIIGSPIPDSAIQIIEIVNLSQESQGMVVAIISVPSCYKLDVNQFELLKQKKVFDSYEIKSDLSQYTLYWTRILASSLSDTYRIGAEIILVKQFKAENCSNRASVAYLYYDAENKIWI